MPKIRIHTTDKTNSNRVARPKQNQLATTTWTKQILTGLLGLNQMCMLLQVAQGRRGHHRQRRRSRPAQPPHTHPGESRGVGDGSVHLRRQEQPRRGI